MKMAARKSVDKSNAKVDMMLSVMIVKDVSLEED
jgi:hypothetical protein